VIRSTLRRYPRISLSAAIVIVALFVRLVPMGRYVTPDEPIWVMRSIRFRDAVRAHAWSQIPQTGHPGLTTMVLGAAGIQITRWLDPVAAAEHLSWLRNLAWLAPENAEAIRRLATFLPAARSLVAVVQSLGLALAYGVGRRRLGERASRWLAVLLALDPLLIGHAGLLHTDALQATFVLLAVLFAIPPSSSHTELLRGRNLERERWLPIVVSGLFLALAGLTKLLGLLIAPGLALALLVGGRGRGVQRWLWGGLLALSAAVFGLVLYPPFWIDPSAAAEILLNAVQYHEGLGLRDTFFMGRMTPDPGPWFYPAVLLFRLTPLALVGLIRGGLWPRRHAIKRAGWFLLPLVGYLTALTVATKKFDRYALTPLVLLTATAALHWGRDKLGRPGRCAFAAGLLLPWALVALLPLHYADPLLGGPWVARHIIPLGWGEGTGLAAGKVAQDAEVKETLLVENVPGAAPFFPGAVRPLTRTPVRCGDAVIAGSSFNRPDWMRQDTVKVAGLSLATVYEPRPLSLEEASMGSDPYLLPGPLPGFEEAASGIAVAPMTDTLYLHRWLFETFGSGGTFRWVRAPDCYPLTDAQIADLVEADVGSITCLPTENASPFDVERCHLGDRGVEPAPWIARFSRGMDLIAVAAPDSVQAPEALAVKMRWLPRGQLGEVEIYLALRDPRTGLIVTEGGRAAVNEDGWRSMAWEPYRASDTEAYVPIPRSLPPTAYQIVLRVSKVGGGWLGFTQSDGDFGGTELSLGSVEVLAPTTSAEALGLSRDVDVALPGVRLLSAEVDEDTVWAGSRLAFRLEALRTGADVPPPLSWMLVCDGEVRDEGDLRWPPEGLQNWPEGFRFELRYAPQLDPTLGDGTCDMRVTADPRPSVLIGDVTVRARERIFSLPGVPQLSIDAAVGDFGTLVGADLSREALQAGEPLTVTLYWRASAGAEQDYTVFVHLTDGAGTVWAQSDAQPAGGRAPTSSWIVGQVIVDRHPMIILELAPPGTYTLWAGMYAPEAGYRLPLDQDGACLPDDRVCLGDLILR
jgi:hypothetical protein